MNRIIPGVNGLQMRILEAGDPANPCVLLLHGFPELAYSWRHVMPALAKDAGCPARWGWTVRTSAR